MGAFVTDASINGTFVGSLVLSNPHNFNFNSGAKITNGNLYVVGTPSITYNGGTVQGRQFLTDGTEVLPATDTRTVVDLNGSASPSNYKIILNSARPSPERSTDARRRSRCRPSPRRPRQTTATTSTSTARAPTP